MTEISLIKFKHDNCTENVKLYFQGYRGRGGGYRINQDHDRT